MSDEKKQDVKLQRWIKHEERSLSNKWYATSRIDLLIISISGGGLYIAFETLKFIKEQKFQIDYNFLQWAGGFFAFAIAINFVSQIFGFYANKNEAEYANKQIKKQMNDYKNDDELSVLNLEISDLDGNCNTNNKRVRICNIASIGAMVVGILLLAIFHFQF